MPMKFKDSKVTQICYHGTDETEITELDKSKIQKDYRDGADSGYLGWGFYLTTDYDYASEYGDNILEFFVNLKNPFILGETEIDFNELVDYVFAKSGDDLSENILSSLYTLKLFSRGVGGDFKNQNSNSTMMKCRKIVIKCSNKNNLSTELISEVKELFVELAKKPNNWLNGLFYCFGKELFHYFISQSFDGVIADGGKEIVVYETQQIMPVKHIEEDVDCDFDLDVSYGLNGISVGDKIKNMDTGEISKVTNVRQDTDDCLIVEYEWDGGCGSFKYWFNRDNLYIDSHYKLLN